MMRTIFTFQVTRLGSEAEAMMELGNLVIFSEEAIKYYESEELESICVMHDFPKSPYFNLKPGQFLRVGEREYEIFAVGEAVNHKSRTTVIPLSVLSASPLMAT